MAVSRLFRLAVVGACGLAWVASPANAVTIFFSFSSDLTDSQIKNGVAGTVFGRVVGLVDNATSAATNVFIDSFTVGGFSGNPVDAVTWSGQFVNSFTLVNGVVTAGRFAASTRAAEPDQFYINYRIGYRRGNSNYASVGAANGISIWNNNGLAGVTFGQGVVPEPAAWALMIAGFGLVGASLRRRQQVSA